ncbi:unnamed protein product [Calicophoron daubneyi]|uniref:O-acyltransferase n=1 Tax=Calicophoron daubneyi TaxID=300641 RepID=A0AAV2TTP1_CALDB
MGFSRCFEPKSLVKYEKRKELTFRTSPDRPVHHPGEAAFAHFEGIMNSPGIVNVEYFLILLTAVQWLWNPLIHLCYSPNPVSMLFTLVLNRSVFGCGLLLSVGNIFVCFALAIEIAFYRRYFGPRFRAALVVFNLLLYLATPAIIVVWCNINPAIGIHALVLYSAVMLKLWSYAAVNYWCYKAKNNPANISGAQKKGEIPEKSVGVASYRVKKLSTVPESPPSELLSQNEVPEDTEKPNSELKRREVNKRDSLLQPTKSHTSEPAFNVYKLDSQELVLSSEEEEMDEPKYIEYPANLTLRNLYYFIFTPTLCYELNFPRTQRIDFSFARRRLIETFFAIHLIFCISEHWIWPAAREQITVASKSTFLYEVICAWRLSYASHIVWLILCFFFFHSAMSALAEVTRFGDRLFYRDWWNATSISVFWRKWNMPVHRFCIRHLYIPLLRRGYSKTLATYIVFFFSGVMHEYCLSFGVHSLHIYIFLYMFLQAPLGQITSALSLNSGGRGNLTVWIMLMPITCLMLLYTLRDFLIY